MHACIISKPRKWGQTSQKVWYNTHKHLPDFVGDSTAIIDPCSLAEEKRDKTSFIKIATTLRTYLAGQNICRKRFFLLPFFLLDCNGMLAFIATQRFFFGEGLAGTGSSLKRAGTQAFLFPLRGTPRSSLPGQLCMV